MVDNLIVFLYNVCLFVFGMLCGYWYVLLLKNIKILRIFFIRGYENMLKWIILRGMVNI